MLFRKSTFPILAIIASLLSGSGCRTVIQESAEDSQAASVEVPAQIDAASAKKFPNSIAANQEQYDFLAFGPNGKSAVLERQLNWELRDGGPLTVAEKAAIAVYTITYQMNAAIIVAGASKLPPYTGTIYRGESPKQLFGNKDIGKTTTITRLTSTSLSKDIAAGFLKYDQPSQLLVIEAETARDISSYSQAMNEGMPEEELLMLPGTVLHIDRIEKDQTFEYLTEEYETKEFKAQVVYARELKGPTTN